MWMFITSSRQPGAKGTYVLASDHMEDIQREEYEELPSDAEEEEQRVTDDDSAKRPTVAQPAGIPPVFSGLLNAVGAAPPLK